MADFKFEITEHIAQLSENKSGWTKELTKVSWNDRPASYDLRTWSEDYDKMGKGITLTDDEVRQLRDALNNLDL
ncbi:hypothetical protein EF384_05340 [Aerococcus agrisoli]|uniref:Transcriptional coactivator p15 (PC4) C-terminal domain-containing protein n=1 Tax=Aerococcus agrisoli TaxID=2487350 RepID=A0A3N4H5U7_9LACT|nr:YdbC family protein [Aerococcus agrisoli]RPA60504.1 hypothetical protein EF384_05340 [Aerococcus agrisoli]